MKMMWVAVVVSACGSAPPPAQPIQNCATQPTKTCATVIAKAAAITHESGREVTMSIGRCAQDDWAQPVRECIDAATTPEALKACGKQYALKGQMFEESNVAEAIRAIGAFKDQMCACKDQACSQKIVDEMTKWSSAHRGDSVGQMTDEQKAKATEISDQLAKCMMAVMPSNGGTP
ncbi:MAG: hypothetical protein QM831_28475 [Kofleriaceae bacterium]